MNFGRTFRTVQNGDEFLETIADLKREVQRREILLAKSEQAQKHLLWSLELIVPDRRITKESPQYFSGPNQIRHEIIESPPQLRFCFNESSIQSEPLDFNFLTPSSTYLHSTPAIFNPALGAKSDSSTTSRPVESGFFRLTQQDSAEGAQHVGAEEGEYVFRSILSELERSTGLVESELNSACSILNRSGVPQTAQDNSVYPLVLELTSKCKDLRRSLRARSKPNRSAKMRDAESQTGFDLALPSAEQMTCSSNYTCRLLRVIRDALHGSAYSPSLNPKRSPSRDYIPVREVQNHSSADKCRTRTRFTVGQSSQSWRQNTLSSPNIQDKTRCTSEGVPYNMKCAVQLFDKSVCASSVNIWNDGSCLDDPVHLEIDERGNGYQWQVTKLKGHAKTCCSTGIEADLKNSRNHDSGVSTSHVDLLSDVHISRHRSNLKHAYEQLEFECTSRTSLFPADLIRGVEAVTLSSQKLLDAVREAAKTNRVLVSSSRFCSQAAKQTSRAEKVSQQPTDENPIHSDRRSNISDSCGANSILQCHERNETEVFQEIQQNDNASSTDAVTLQLKIDELLLTLAHTRTECEKSKAELAACKQYLSGHFETNTQDILLAHAFTQDLTLISQPQQIALSELDHYHLGNEDLSIAHGYLLTMLLMGRRAFAIQMAEQQKMLQMELQGMHSLLLCMQADCKELGLELGNFAHLCSPENQLAESKCHLAEAVHRSRQSEEIIQAERKTAEAHLATLQEMLQKELKGMQADMLGMQADCELLARHLDDCCEWSLKLELAECHKTAKEQHVGFDIHRQNQSQFDEALSQLAIAKRQHDEAICQLAETNNDLTINKARQNQATAKDLAERRVIEVQLAMLTTELHGVSSDILRIHAENEQYVNHNHDCCEQGNIHDEQILFLVEASKAEHKAQLQSLQMQLSESKKQVERVECELEKSKCQFAEAVHRFRQSEAIIQAERRISEAHLSKIHHEALSQLAIAKRQHDEAICQLAETNNDLTISKARQNQATAKDLAERRVIEVQLAMLTTELHGVSSDILRIHAENEQYVNHNHDCCEQGNIHDEQIPFLVEASKAEHDSEAQLQSLQMQLSESKKQVERVECELEKSKCQFAEAVHRFRQSEAIIQAERRISEAHLSTIQELLQKELKGMQADMLGMQADCELIEGGVTLEQCELSKSKRLVTEAMQKQITILKMSLQTELEGIQADISCMQADCELLRFHMDECGRENQMEVALLRGVTSVPQASMDRESDIFKVSENGFQDCSEGIQFSNRLSPVGEMAILKILQDCRLLHVWNSKSSEEECCRIPEKASEELSHGITEKEIQPDVFRDILRNPLKNSIARLSNGQIVILLEPSNNLPFDCRFPADCNHELDGIEFEGKLSNCWPNYNDTGGAQEILGTVCRMALDLGKELADLVDCTLLISRELDKHQGTCSGFEDTVSAGRSQNIFEHDISCVSDFMDSSFVYDSSMHQLAIQIGEIESILAKCALRGHDSKSKSRSKSLKSKKASWAFRIMQLSGELEKARRKAKSLEETVLKNEEDKLPWREHVNQWFGS